MTTFEPGDLVAFDVTVLPNVHKGYPGARVVPEVTTINGQVTGHAGYKVCVRSQLGVMHMVGPSALRKRMPGK